MNNSYDHDLVIISSRDNEAVKQVVRLHTARERREQRLFIAEGQRCCRTLVEAGVKFERLYVTEPNADVGPEIAEHGVWVGVTDSVMDKMSTAKTPSGVLGVFHIPTTPTIPTSGPGLVLTGISDPGNAGTLIRSAVAFGATSVVMVDGVDPWSPKVVQASAGMVGALPIVQCSAAELEKVKGRFTLCALTMDGKDALADCVPANTLLVVGNESHGIAPEIFKMCDQQVSIPMAEQCESLNAAVAGSIALYVLRSSS